MNMNKVKFSERLILTIIFGLQTATLKVTFVFFYKFIKNPLNPINENFLFSFRISKTHKDNFQL